MELTEEERSRMSRPSFRMSGAGRRPESKQGTGEALTTIGAGILSSVPAGIAGLGVLPFKGVDKAVETIDAVQDYLTPVPKTDEGNRMLQRMGGAMETLGAPAEYIGEKTREITGSPALATAAEMALDPLNLIGSAVAGKAVASGARAVGRGARAAGRELGPKAAEMAEGYMRRAGMMPQIFIGKSAKTWDAASNARAAEMEAAGTPPQAIWRETGNWRAPDGQWRQEISDAPLAVGRKQSTVTTEQIATNESNKQRLKEVKRQMDVVGDQIDTHRMSKNKGLRDKLLNDYMKLRTEENAINDSIWMFSQKQKAQSEGMVGDLVQGPLLEAYPSLAPFKLKDEPQNRYQLGAYDKKNKSIILRVPSEQRKPVFVHEGQHFVQDVEGFSPGYAPTSESVKAYQDYLRYMGEAEARAAEARMNLTPEERRAKFPEESYDVPIGELIDAPRTGGPALLTTYHAQEKAGKSSAKGAGAREVSKAGGGAVEGGNMSFAGATDEITRKLVSQGMSEDQAMAHALRMADSYMKGGGAVMMARGGPAGGGARATQRAMKRSAEAAAKRAAEKAAAEKAAAPVAPARTAAEQSVLGKFGQKQQQEAQRAAKVAQISQSTEPPRPARAPAKGGRAAAVPPDVYRQMAKTQGDEAVIRAAERGEHLKPTAGGYVGAPRTVTNPQALGAMRRAMDKDFIDSVEAVRLADPDRLGTWYDRAKAGIAQSAEPYQLDRTLDQHAVYSAGVSPESELGFALKHQNSRVAGQPERAYRGPGMRTLDTAVAEDRPAKLAFKVGEYREKNDPRVPNTGLFGVNDFRRAQGMGYTDPEGKPWKAGVTATMHPFMDAETALQVSRANRAGIGGRTDWQGPHIQELPWVYGKAQDLYSRGQRGRFAGDPLEGMKSSIREANKTAQDYMYKHAASATHEAIPGASLGHVRQALDMPPEQKVEYGRKGRWDQPAPEAKLNPLPQVGAGNRDVLYGAAGYRQLPSREAQGLYTNKLGQVETNPMTIARPLMDFPTGGGGGFASPNTRKVAETLEQFRAFMDAQEAGAYNLPNTMSAVKGKRSMVLDARGRNKDKADPSAGALPTSQQLAQMNSVLEDTGFGVSATNRGAVVFPYDPTMDPKQAQKILRQKRGALTSIFPSDPQMSMTTTGYVPGVGKRGQFGPESTAPFSGEATSDVLRAFADLEPNVSLNISESEAVRQAIRDKALRDSLMGGTRRDIQESRRFFSEADWPRAVEMIRQGMAPAAALAALGYSASAMAEEGR